MNKQWRDVSKMSDVSWLLSEHHDRCRTASNNLPHDLPFRTDAL